MEEREEERATAVPNREGKAKSRWTVASLPWYTKRSPGLHVHSEILVEKDSPSSHWHVGTGPHVNETSCVISRAKCDLAALSRGATLVIDLYFFNGVPISFEARLTGTVRRENINYSTTTPPPVLVV